MATTGPGTSGSTTMSITTADTTTTTTTSSTTSGGGTTQGTGSTGSVPDYALLFSGDGHVESQQTVPFTAQDFTVEVWANFLTTNAHGCLVNHMNTTHSAGWLFGIPGELVLVFAFWPQNGPQQIIVNGPTIASIGTGWHHLAATKAGTTLTLFVDGVPTTQQAVPMAGPSEVLTVEVGDQANSLGGQWHMLDAVIDDVRISDTAIWTAPFVPESDFQVLPSTTVLLRFDEGMGTIATDAKGLVFDITGADWTQGHP